MGKKFTPKAFFILIFATLLWGGFAVYATFAVKTLPTSAQDGVFWEKVPGGLVPREILPGSPADRAGLLPTDTLLLVNRVSVTSEKAVQEVIEQLPLARPAQYTVRRDGALVKLEVAVDRKTFEVVRRWLLQLAGFGYIILALFVYRKKPELPTARAFFFFGLLAGSTLTAFFVDASRLPDFLQPVFLLWIQLNIFFIPALGLDFFRRLVFFPPARVPPRGLTLLTYLPAFLGFGLMALALSVAKGWLTIEPVIGFLGKIRPLFQPGNLEPANWGIYLLWFVLEFAVRVKKKEVVINARQRQWLQWGVVLPLLVYVVFNQVLPLFWSWGLLKWSALVILPSQAVLAYLILKERLLEIGVVIKRSAIYAILSASLIGIFVLLVLGISQLMVLLTGQTSILAAFAAALLTAIVLNLYRQKFQNYLDRKFFKDRYNYQRALLEFSKELGRLENLETLLAKISKQFAEALHLSNCLPFLYNQKADAYVMVAPYGLAEPVLSQVRYAASQFGLATLLVQEKHPLDFYDLETKPLYFYLPVVEKVALKKTDTALAVPLLVKEKLVGMLLLGNKKSGDLFSSEDVDFFATLSAPLAVAVENARLHQEELGKKELEREIVLAGEVQKRFLKTVPAQLPGLEIGALNLPSRQVSGDLYAIIPLDEKRLGIAIGDVAGKGMSASLLMALVQATLETLAPSVAAPAELLQRLNTAVCRNSTPGRFVTLFYGIYDTETKRFAYANAGHNPPVWLGRQGVRALDEAGLLLGVDPKARYPQGLVHLKPEDLVVLYTDGVTEASNTDEHRFEEERLHQCLLKSRTLSAPDVLQAVVEAVRAFAGTSEFEDDLTLVGLKVV